jgi:hypothetical protein
MRKSTKFLGALAVAGLVAAGGSAFTSTGVTNNAGPTQFIGGTVSQSVTGATISTIAYNFSDATKTAVTTIVLTFADATGGKTPTLVSTGTGPADVYTCTAIAAGTFISTCSAALPDPGVTSVAITVT